VTGVRDEIGEKLDPHLFASVQVDYPFSNAPTELILSDELYLSSCAYINDEQWRGGLDDNLRNRRGVKWSRLQVLNSDVARWWPFPSEHEHPVSAEPYRTGAPGLPTSMQLVAIEHTERWLRGEALTSIVAESDALAQWLIDTHPSAPRLSAKAIRNNLSAEHRRRISDAWERTSNRS